MRRFFVPMGIFVLLNAFAFTVRAQPQFDAPEITTNAYYQVEGNWSEMKRGWNPLILKVSNPNQQAVVGAKLNLKYDMSGMQMNPPIKPIVDHGDGTYETQVFLGMMGGWVFAIQIQTDVAVDSLNRQIKITH